MNIRDFLHYDPETGEWTWLVTKTNCVPSGSRAGTKHQQSGYIYIAIDRKSYFAHRLAWFYMTGKWPKDCIDHIDGDPANNRWSNLREATRSENMGNTRIRVNNTSGFKGVSQTRSNKWIAYINHKGKRSYLGRFETKEAAAAAYAAAAKELFGVFANIGTNAESSAASNEEAAEALYMAKPASDQVN